MERDRKGGMITKNNKGRGEEVAREGRKRKKENYTRRVDIEGGEKMIIKFV